MKEGIDLRRNRRLQHDTNMKSTFMNMPGQESPETLTFPHLQMQIYFACRTNVKGAPGPSSRNLQQIAWDGPVLLHQAQTLWMGTHLQVHPKKHCLSQITLLEKE